MPLFKKRATADDLTGTTTGPPASSKARNGTNHFMPKWVLGLRALQLLLAILVLGLASYAEHVYHLHAAYIPAMMAAVLTILAFVPLTVWHLLARGRLSNDKMAFLTDLIAMLLWLAVMAVLASYSHIMKPIDSSSGFFFDADPMEFYRADSNTVAFNGKRKIASPYSTTASKAYNSVLRRLRRGWRAGAAAAAFSGLEFLIFLITTLLFLKYYLAHRFSSTNPPNYVVENGIGTGPGSFEMQHAGHTEGSPIEQIGAASRIGSGPIAPDLKTTVDQDGHAGPPVGTGRTAL